MDIHLESLRETLKKLEIHDCLKDSLPPRVWKKEPDLCKWITYESRLKSSEPHQNF